MMNRELIDKISAETDDTMSVSVSELEAIRDKELSKPENEIDFDYVNELNLSIIEISGEKPIEVNVSEKAVEIQDRMQKKKSFRIPKWCVGLACACLALVFGNIYTVNAYDMNVFSLLVEFSKGGVTVDFEHKNDEIVLPVSDDDPYGIIAKCEENGIYPDTPHYLPEGFVLTIIESGDDGICNSMHFRFEKGNESIVIHYMQYYTENYEDYMRCSIPSDEHNVSEVMVNGLSAIVSKEDDQMNMLYNHGTLLMNMFTENVDYSECEKILNSIY